MFKRKSYTTKYAIIVGVILYVYIYILPIQKQQLIPQGSTVSAPIASTDDHILKESTYVGNCLGDNVERNVDNNHRDSNRAYWNQLSDISIDRYRFGWKDFVRQERAKPQPTKWEDQKGIVFVAGNDDTMKRTVGTIRLLRSFECTLPIEIWHMEHEAQAASAFTSKLQALGNVRLRDLSEYGLPKAISRMRNRGKQFQVKAAAIINSRFQHVLYLDSDNIPTRDPAFLFESTEYKQTGALFWPDFWKTAAENKIFRLLEIECVDTWEQESGQIVVDKARHWIPLQLSWFMQYFHEVYFRLLNGDKDTFQYAWRALDAPFHRIETFVGMGGLMLNGTFCGHSMLQYAKDGSDHPQQPLFVHANLMKQIPKSVFLGNSGAIEKQRPWHLIKRYRDDQFNNFLKPEFYTVENTTIGCMNFASRKFDNESPSYVESFDEVLPSFQDEYFRSGGIGGYE
ncbi:ADP-heptose:LPS heptosyltransferase-like protein [Mucor ambiguus]|uniref:ADP-heptose:LPS heptosyltransferase-like protein n=1 Tax=Mucor ambiguus TaxID=91626 RepID=A0A0C9M9N9_9FUNG|nr:ADP-heptose:LPS heptosyltransferase-like protein [Mucor ambiguus]